MHDFIILMNVFVSQMQADKINLMQDHRGAARPKHCTCEDVLPEKICAKQMGA